MTSKKVSSFVRSFENLAIVYLVVSVLVGRAFQNAIVIIVVTSASIILIPLLVGKTIIAVIFRKQRNPLHSSVFASAAVEWFTGNLFIYFLASILSLAKLLDAHLFSFSLILFPAIYLIITGLRKTNPQVNDSMPERIHRTFGNKIVIPFIFLAGLLPLCQIIPVQPFPLSSTGSIDRIRYTFDFMNKGSIELVGGYSNWISVILGVLSSIYDFHPLQILSATSYISHIVYPFALYLISYKITKDAAISLIPAFVGPWIFLEGSLCLTELTNTPLTLHIFTWMLYIALEYYHSSSPPSISGFSIRSSLLPLLIIFLSPITYILGKGGRVIAPAYFVFLSLILPMFLIVIYYILNKTCERKISILVSLVFPLTLVAIAHPFLGPMVIFFLAFFFLTLSIFPKHLKKSRIITLTLLAVVLILPLLQVSLPSNLILSRLIFGDLLKGGGADINIKEKWIIFFWHGPELAVFLYFLSAILISISGDRKFVPLAFTSSVISFVALSPEGSLYRATAYLNPLTAIMLSYLLLLSISAIKRMEKKRQFQNVIVKMRRRCSANKFKDYLRPKIFYLAIVLVLLLPNIAVARTRYIENFLNNSGEGYWSYVQTYDVEASFWVYNNFRNERILIISDPATMFFLGPLTGKDTLMTEYIYFLPQEYSNETWIRMEQLKQKVFFSSSGENSYNGIREILSSGGTQSENNYSKVLVVITPRTYYWLYKNSTFPIVVERSSVASKILAKFSNNKFFDLVYKVDTVLYLYEIKIAPI